MKTTLRAVALAAFAVVAAPAFAAFDANIEFDNTYLNNHKATPGTPFIPGAPGQPDTPATPGMTGKRGLQQSGRVELNAFGKAGADVFIAGRASFLAKKDGTAAVDDMWVQAGTAAADVKLGRFEAADLFPIPRDVLVLYAGGDVGTAGEPFVYRANALRGRFGNNSDGGYTQGVFHAAATFNAGGGLSFELGVVEAPNDTSNKGLRPVVTYAAGPLTLKAGIESVRFAFADKRETGFGLTAAYNLGGVTLIGNYAHVKVDDNKANTYGLIANADMGIAGGVIISKVTIPGAEAYKTQTFYAAYNMPFFDIKGATISPAVSFSKGSGSNDAPDEKGLRLRFNYSF